jgi:HEAT repeat protein
LPVLQAWLKREEDGQVLTLARGFGRRLAVFTELVAMLEVILWRTREIGYASSILSLFEEYVPELLATLVPKMLEQDKSSIVLSVVYRYLHRFRQDLLTPYLGQHAYGGRFSTGQTRFVLGLNSGFFRWTPRQQTTFARTLLEVAQDDQRSTSTIIYTLYKLVAMPAIDPAFVIQFASDERIPVRDTALQVLGKLDGGQGISVLIEALGDDRARVAIYALRSSLLELSSDEALKILRATPMKQITVAKEVVRLIGEMETEEAYRLLLEFERDTELHRDVRVALLRALWSYVERDETWEIFERAARWPDAGIARGVVRIPADGMSAQAQQRLLALLSTLLAHPLTEVRVATLERCVLYPISDHQHVLLASLLKAMNSRFPDEVAQAARAVFAIYTNHDPALIGDTLRALLSNRRSLRTVIYTFTSSLSYARSRFLPTTRAILSVLSEDRLTLGLQISLIFDGLPWEEVATELIKRVDYLHADALEHAASMIHQSSRRPDAELDSLEATLAASDDERLRRLALSALVAGASRPTGWSKERIARLQTYQQDPSPLVAEAAQFTFEPLS